MFLVFLPSDCDRLFGIELKEGALGRHDGQVQNKRYFTAPKQRGIFVKSSRIRRKARQRDRKSSFKLNRSAAIEQLKKRESTEKKRWRAPYEVYESNNIERTSMRVMYTKASSNLHTHILQKVNEAKIRNDIRNSANNMTQRTRMFSAHSAVSKLHSPMIPIHIMAVNNTISINSPIITTQTVSTQTMQGITRKMMKRKRKKRSSLIMHKRPSIDEKTNPFALPEKDHDDIYDDEKQLPEQMASIMSPITFSPRQAIDTAVAPPLSQVTIAYVEMEDKVNALIALLIEREDVITDAAAVYKQCEITESDLNEDLFNWVDLLCTHNDLFSQTLRVKDVSKDNSFFTYKTEDLDDDDLQLNLADEDSDCTADEQSNDTNATPTPREKEKETLRRKNALLMRNACHKYYSSSDAYYYTVFERLLFELKFCCLYFIYDIGLDNCSALSEQHPSQLFMLSGNMSQILRKCSPVLHGDIDLFYGEILSPHELSIRYSYLNCSGKCNTIDMTKYSLCDGIRNDYSFVGRIQYEEMFFSGDKTCDCDDLHYELICSGVTIYKSVIPSVFTCLSQRITNLKRSIYSPSLVMSACHIECEKWNEDGDYYGFIRIAVDNQMIMNAKSVICAAECGYYKGNGLGVGHFANVRKDKTKYYSGGAYATSADAPHESCPAAACYGESIDLLLNDHLYYGSPSHDENERAGGIIDIVCNESFINHGTINANGANGMQFGGSSGGSIKIQANAFTNYGQITANGGKGTVYQRKGSKRKQCGTDGGDGRIFIICNTFVNKGKIEPIPTIITPIPKQYNQHKNTPFSTIKSLHASTNDF